MSLADALAHEMKAPGPKCSVAYTLNRLGPDDLATFSAALADKDVTAAALSRALKSISENVSAFSLNRHRKGDCGCG